MEGLSLNFNLELGTNIRAQYNWNIHILSAAEVGALPRYEYKVGKEGWIIREGRWIIIRIGDGIKRI